MIRIDDNTVELTEHEQALSNLFNVLLDVGFNIDEAIDQLRPFKLSPELEAWLR